MSTENGVQGRGETHLEAAAAPSVGNVDGEEFRVHDLLAASKEFHHRHMAPLPSMSQGSGISAEMSCIQSLISMAERFKPHAAAFVPHPSAHRSQQNPL